LQQPDGYLNSWYIRMQPGKRWTNLRDCHELYCAGHLMEAAVAYHQATGKRKLLDVMIRYADHIDQVFGPKPSQKQGYCGHEEIELALVRLARETGEQRYMDLAKFFIDARGQQPHYFDLEAKARGDDPSRFAHGTFEYNQSHLPVRQQTKVVGHAVRAMYLYSGMADIAAEYGDDSLTDALEILWDDVTGKQMYVTGGIGPAARNEGFTDYYDLPNDTAYAETCAAVGLAFWASRMLGRQPDRRYADIMEQALYNGALSGLSADGSRFFYENPLESHGHHHRWDWHRCPCCPPNIARLVASIGTYMYGVADNAVAVHLYGESTARLEVAGTPITVTQNTQYPWDGAIRMTLNLSQPTRFTLSLRIPGWCTAPEISVGSERMATDTVGALGYLAIEREWRDGDSVDLVLPMSIAMLRAHPKVRQDIGRVAVARGPLIYCLEETDNGGHLNAIVLGSATEAVKTQPIPEFDGALSVSMAALRTETGGWNGHLYRADPPKSSPTEARFVPYHLWDNRNPGEMLVWVRAQA
ncbi:MAG TPA: beta-L-arabinofuranosidase domain-containing protein, partial [Ramlibacter sp.]